MNYRTAIKWAIIYTVISLLWTLGENLSGLHYTYLEAQPFVTNFVLVPYAVCYFLAVKEYRDKDFRANMTWQQGFTFGMITTFIIVYLSIPALYFSLYWISPSFFANAQQYAINCSYMTEQEAKDYYSWGNYLQQTVVFIPVIGVIYSATAATFLRKK